MSKRAECLIGSAGMSLPCFLSAVFCLNVFIDDTVIAAAGPDGPRMHYALRGCFLLVHHDAGMNLSLDGKHVPAVRYPDLGITGQFLLPQQADP